MATKVSSSLEDPVECPICLDQYQDPRILPCQHTFCRKCLEGLLHEADSGWFSIQCPECRMIVRVKDVSSLQVDTLVNRLLALVELSKDTVKEYKGQLQKKMQCLRARGTKKEVESALKAVKDMQEKVRENAETVKKEIDEKIDVKIAILEETRAKLKQESTSLTAMKMEKLCSKQDDLEMRLVALISVMEFAKNILSKGSKRDVLSMTIPIQLRLTELSKKEIDVEVDEKYEQILQVNEIPNFHEDIVNYLVIKDRFAPDTEKCTVGWIEGTSNICLQVRNYFGELIHIKANRIQIDCPRVRVKCTKTGEFLIESRAVIFKRPSDLHRDDTSDGELKNLEVLVDGLSVRGSPLEVITKRISVWQKTKLLFTGDSS